MNEIAIAQTQQEVWIGYWRICRPEKYELFEERAAIMEFDGGLSREEAEREAYQLMSQYE
tara:strand:- start:295 stop:474 length:180 start_codon:yes stop_codon:yes gene_type:complete